MENLDDQIVDADNHEYEANDFWSTATAKPSRVARVRRISIRGDR